MDSNILLIRGIHPGIILERELKKRNLGKGHFAMSINEFPQTLTSITKGKRRMNTLLSLKIERALNMEEGYFIILQIYHDIEKEKRKLTIDYHPNLSLLRSVLFWDTKISEIDWEKNKSAVIERVFDRGNDQEISEIIRFYGKNTILAVLDQLGQCSPISTANRIKYL